MRYIYRFIGVNVLIFIFILMVACSSSSSDSAANSSPQAKGESNYDSGNDAGFMNTTSGRGEVLEQETSSVRRSDSESNSSGFLSGEGLNEFNLKMIYKANLSLEVENYGDAQTEIRTLTHQSNGYILEFSENQTSHERSGNFVIKVPSQGFMSFITELEKIEAVSLQTSYQGQDVTEEYMDLNARLKAKQVVEARLLDFMEKASRTDDLLAFSKELANVQEEIERHKGRIRYLDQNVEFSTVDIRVYEKNKNNISSKSEDPKLFSERISGSMQSSLNFISVFFQELVIFFAGALPVLLVLSVILLPILYIIRRNKK